MYHQCCSCRLGPSKTRTGKKNSPSQGIRAGCGLTLCRGRLNVTLGLGFAPQMAVGLCVPTRVDRTPQMSVWTVTKDFLQNNAAETEDVLTLNVQQAFTRSGIKAPARG